MEHTVARWWNRSISKGANLDGGNLLGELSNVTLALPPRL